MFPIWNPVDIVSGDMTPDVLIGLNAGLSMYETWRPVISSSRALAIPFATTEFTRISLTEDMFNFKYFVEGARRGLSEVVGQDKMEVLAKSFDDPPCSARNPFMRPGHKA